MLPWDTTLLKRLKVVRLTSTLKSLQVHFVRNLFHLKMRIVRSGYLTCVQWKLQATHDALRMPLVVILL